MTKLFRIAHIITLGLLLAASPPVIAQVTTGQITGRVTDAYGRPIKAILVLTAPQLMGQRVVTTDSKGEWRALLLPPGGYTIKIQSDGHIGATIRNLRVGVGQSIRQDNILKAVAVASTTVEITGHDVIAFDKTDTKTSVNYSEEKLAQLGGEINFWSAASMTPGVIMSGGNPVIRGGQVNSVNFRLDGADIKDPHQGTVDAVWYVVDSIEDIQVVLSPLNARYGRTLGGSINMVSKSGGNEFGGSLRANIDRDSWRGRSRDIEDDETQREGGNVSDAFSRTWDITMTGPIWKDRVWFMFGTSITPAKVANSKLIAQDSRYRKTILAGDDRINKLLEVDSGFYVTQSSPLPTGYYIPFWDALQSYDSTQNNKFYEGKLTAALSTNNRITFGGSHQEWVFDRSGSGSYLRLAQSDSDRYTAQGWNIGYDSMIGEKTFAEVKVYRNRQWNKWGWGDLNA
ncbi:MAG: TonB-dependent receptor, partial [Holophagales bacterium]|nr:TonB-dependent receptor [Holophagales bacterium]